MGNFFKKQGTMRIIVTVVALLLVVGLIGGVMAMGSSMKGSTASSRTTSSTVTPTNGGSNSQGGSSAQGGTIGQGGSMEEEPEEITPQFTLTYSTGLSGTGSVPSAVTACATVLYAVWDTPW